MTPRFALEFGFAPWRLSGTVYCALLNDAGHLAALGDALHAPPYKAPPQAPVLGIKPRNTLVREGATVAVPADAPGLEIGASLALVIGRTACRLRESEALAHVAGCTLAADLSVPLASHYRPAVRQRARDGYCPVGPRVVALGELGDLEAIEMRVLVDGWLVLEADHASHIRPAARLLADITEFMTLAPGDLLLLGAPAGVPCVPAGHDVEIQVDAIGDLAFRLAAEEPR